MNAWCKRNRAEKLRKKRKKQLKKKNRRVSNFTPLTEKEEKSLQSKKRNYFVTECASHQIHIPLTTRERERERDDDDDSDDDFILLLFVVLKKVAPLLFYVFVFKVVLVFEKKEYE